MLNPSFSLADASNREDKGPAGSQIHSVAGAADADAFRSDIIAPSNTDVSLTQ